MSKKKKKKKGKQKRRNKKENWKNNPKLTVMKIQSIKNFIMQLTQGLEH